MLIEDDFIAHLFQIIEELSDDVNDPYHYPVIRVLVCVYETLARDVVLTCKTAGTQRTIYGLRA